MNKKNDDLEYWKAYLKTVKPILQHPYYLDALDINQPNHFVLENNKKDTLDFSNFQRDNAFAKQTYNISQNFPKNDFLADKNMKKKMKKGRFLYDAKIDLHGFTQEQAFDALTEFITFNYQRKMRHLLIVTGKGRFCYQNFESLGVLIKKVPQWLKSPPFSQVISVIEEASMYDGGEGALYVILKKN